jgi:two-component system KDP operon response regulator KdpE
MSRILVVEDDDGIRNLLRTLLESAGYRVHDADRAARGLVEARAGRPDLVLVDLGLPDRDGLMLIREVRAFSAVPIVVLSARSLDATKIEALDAGADDYVTKPFNPAELLARLRAALRRSVRTGESTEPLRIGGIEIDLAAREGRGPQGPVHFTPLEYRVLTQLAQRNGLIATHAALIREVWGPVSVDDTRGLRACIKTLRQKIEPNPARPIYLTTEIGIGYRLKRTSSDTPEPD